MEVEAAAAAAFINVAIENMIKVSKELSPIFGLHKNAAKLSGNLETVQNVLKDIEMQTIPIGGAVKHWLKELGTKVLVADNSVDELKYHLLKETYSFKLPTNQAKVLTYFSSNEKGALIINEINDGLESFKNEANKIGLGKVPTLSQTDSLSADGVLVGRDEDMLKLAELLITSTSEGRVFSVLAIQGKAGVGRTMFARKLFNHESIKAQFGELRIWVDVGIAFEPIDLLKKILATFTCDQVESRDDILKRLQQAIKGKACLLVLDSVCVEDVPRWNEFVNWIKEVTSMKGNIIIITTKNRKVADMVSPVHIHPLNVLSGDECWSIIKSIAFGNSDVPSGFETTGRKIAPICGGCPSAANLVGGMLCGKSQERWELIAGLKDEWECMLDIYGLRLENLSQSSMKTCFAYCSIFPYDFKIVKEELIELWMAEGFLQPNEGDDMESTGEMLLNELVQNLMLQAERDENGNVESFVMHHSMHDLASYILLGSRNGEDGLLPVRYMMIRQESSPIQKQVAKHLRTLFLEGEISDKMLVDYTSLRNLRLARAKELPSSIMKLIHLRNLNISKSSIKQLPEWIGELYNLQTLRAETEYLWKLPSSMKCLINLRHLYVLRCVKLPADMGRLTNLRTLRYFAVGENKGYQIEELKSLNNLKGEVHISNLEKVRNKEEAAKANIHRKQNLSELVLSWSLEREGQINDENVLEGLQPHSNLKKLGIVGFKGNRFPSWTREMAVRDGPLENLTQLTLSSCSECREIPKLEHLKNLKSLSLIKLEKVVSIESPFSNLMSFYIRDLKRLRSLPDWLFRKNQNLSKLEITGCSELKKLPDGLEMLHSLEELYITNCEKMTMIGNPDVREGQCILRVLRIVECIELMELPCKMLESWVPSLEILKMSELQSLKNLPMLVGCLAKSARLRKLEIGCVPQFMNGCEFKDWHFGSLQKLHLDVSEEKSPDIEQKVDAILQGNCNSLTRLCLVGQQIWETVPKSIERLTGLSKLDLQKLGIEELPEWFGNLVSLVQLNLSSCSKLKRLLSRETLERLTKLRHLYINNCPELRIGSAWCNAPHLTIKLDNRWIEPCTNEIVDGGMSSAAVEFIFKSLGNTLKEDRSSIGDVQQLQGVLSIAQSYLNDAQNKSIGEQPVKVWLTTVQAVAFEADKVLNELDYHYEVRKLKKPRAKDKFLSCISYCIRFNRRRDITLKIKQINHYFNLMIFSAKLLDIAPAPAPPLPRAFFETNSLTLDPIFEGRDDTVEKLVEKLTTDIPGKAIFSILAIHGVAGVGKETLTRKIFNHEDIKARFGSHLWVLVSRVSSPIMLFKNILSTLTSETKIGGVETEESILKKLQQVLKAKTYLLVLDDICIEDVPQLEKFINSISRVSSTRGNAIIITTKKEEVALSVKPFYHYHLEGLSIENCWSIIKSKAFQNGGVQSGHEIDGTEIAKRCQGLPLAANIFGGVLHHKSKQEWSSVTENWHSDSKEAGNISNILKLGFDSLPSVSLKMCLAYCSIFPKGCKIVKNELIELWMAEGFLDPNERVGIEPNERVDMESVGEMFLNVLLHYSLLQVAERDANGNVLSYMMHDLVRNLASAVLKSAHDLFCEDADKDDASSVIYLMRTLIFRGDDITMFCEDITMFGSYKSLHALTIDCDRVRELPSSIRELKHLRNLNVSRTRIEYLPDWISEFHYLQTLNASTESLRELPSTLTYLIRLRHLYLCRGVDLPSEIGRLNHLQELMFRVSEQKGYTIEELGSLNNLKQLYIENLEKVHNSVEAKKAKLSEKENLLSLTLEWDENREGEKNDDDPLDKKKEINDAAVLEDLKPHPGLQMLKIAGFKGERFPPWAQKLTGFDMLIEITLSGCQGCQDIPELGQLKKLKTLSLWRLSNVTSINSSFYGNIDGAVISFPALETLLVTDMAELKEIQDFGKGVEVFPSLVSLKIYWCNKLERLPSQFFLKAGGLKELDIRHCSMLSRFPDGLHILDHLKSLTVKGCQNLEWIVNPESGGSLNSLCSLEIRDCQKLTAMVEPQGPSLKKVSMSELKSLEHLPMFLDCLANSHSLAQLTIVGIPYKFTSNTLIKNWPFQRLRKLEIDLTMEYCSSVAVEETVDNMLQNCRSSLGELKLTGLYNWKVPGSIERLTALYSLELENFGVFDLPEWFGDLSCLKRLCLSIFPKLRHLPSMKLLTELQEFHISNCPKIRMENEGHKIFHRCITYVNGHQL